jgi:hypothetical protein
MVAGFDAEFVVAASQVLNEGVAPDHVARGLIGSQTAHRPEPRLEPSVIAFDPVVGVPGGVMEHFWEKVIDDAQQRCSKISRHLSWPVAARQHRLEESGGGGDVASLRHQYVNDLVVLIDCPVHVPPHTGHPHVGFIDEPAVADAVTAWPCRVDDERGEALHPPVNRDVINLDATLGEELFDIAVGQAIAEMPAHRQQDHVWREPEANERRGSRAATTNHQARYDPRRSLNATVPGWVAISS